MRLPVVAAVTLALLFPTVRGWSQESRAVVVGRVTDGTGAVIPAADVSFTKRSEEHTS